MKIIFAQGNPGQEYENTRHNIGFIAIDAIAKKYESNWTNKPKFNAHLATVTMAGEKVILIKPMTYYNETGLSARSIADFYKISPGADLIVIHDDLALPFGTIRVRGKGSDAGNNGIKSLNAHIGADYTRIRVGIWNEFRDKMGDTDFVVSNFRNAETRQLKKNVIPQIIEIAEQFCAGETKHTSYSITF
jgi:PTH1 family peptidyl-tRNA hydrolase